MKRLIVLLLLILSLLLISCGNDSEPTGAVSVDTTDTASLLQVKVIDETGGILDDVEIYVNNIFKGKTSKYGESKGTKLVILNGEKNEIQVKKKGYFGSTPTAVSAAGGEQKITVVLEEERTTLSLEVKDKTNLKLGGAEVSLFLEENQPERMMVTNKEGLVTFDKLDDGSYTIIVNQESYEPYELEQEINFSQNGKELELIVELTKLPHLEVEVVDHQGRDLIDVEVSFYTKEDYNNPGGIPLHIKHTNAEGMVEFNEISLEEDYVVILKKAGFEAQTHEKTISEDNQFLHAGMELVQEE